MLYYGDDMRELIKDIRSYLNMSQQEFADKLSVTFASVNRWENGHALPNKLAQIKLSEFCAENNVPVYEMILSKVNKAKDEIMNNISSSTNEIKSDISNSKNEILRKIDSSNASINNKIDSSSTATNSKIDDVNSTVKNNESYLKKILTYLKINF